MGASTYSLAGAVDRDRVLSVLGRTFGIYNVTDRPYNARGDGVTDDLAAIQNATYDAMGNTQGGVVLYPPGQYATSGPIVTSAADVLHIGVGALATMGGAGQNDSSGSCIKPLASWSQGSASQPAAFLFDGVLFGSNMGRCGVERLSVLGSNLPGGTLMHGVVTYGNVGSFSMTGCIISTIANTSSNGLYNIADGGGTTAQGSSIMRNIIQGVGNNAFDLAAGDLTMEHCHAQSNGGRGISITASGGDTRIANCRSDLSSNASGFYVNVPCGQYLGMIQLSNCSTQRNQQNGIVIENTVSNGEISPVYLSNCVFQGDGIDTTSAAIRLAGQVGAVITGCGSHVNTVDVGAGVPKTAIRTTSGGTAAPVFLQMSGGFYNAVTAFSDVINAPSISQVDVLEYHGGQWGTGHTPLHRTTL